MTYRYKGAAVRIRILLDTYHACGDVGYAYMHAYICVRMHGLRIGVCICVRIAVKLYA